MEGINFSQISLFPFFLHPVFSLLRSPLLLFSACLSLLFSFFLCLSYFHSRLFPFIMSFISCLPLFSFFPSPSCLSLSASFSTIFFLSFPFFVSCFVSLLSFCVRLQNCEKRLLTSSCLSVCLSVCPHGTTRLQLYGFSLNFTFKYFPKVCRGKSSLIEIWQEQRVLYMKPCICMKCHL